MRESGNVAIKDTVNGQRSNVVQKMVRGFHPETPKENVGTCPHYSWLHKDHLPCLPL
jgi:hypothetical protein